MEWLSNIRKYFQELPEKKRYLEFITAMLSIPVLLSVVYMNYMNIQEKKNPKDESNVTPTVITIIKEREKEEQKEKTTPSPTPQPTKSAECKPEVGDVTITSPQEGATVSDNPLTIIIDQNDPNEEYCAVVWSYRINGGPWSNFDDKDISIYNMESGQKRLEVRVKSLISGEEKTLVRSFTYQNTQAVPTTAPTSTPSPSPTVATQ